MKIIFIFFAISILLLDSKESFANLESKIIVKVENEIVTNFEIKNKILSSLIISNQEINQNNINKYKKEVLNLLIDNKLKKIEVSKYKIEKNTSKTDAYIRSISSDIFSLKEKFNKNNLDFQLYFEELTIEFMWQELIYKLYANKINVDENIIKKEVANYMKNDSTYEELRISEIEVFFNNKKELEEKIFEVEEEIKLSGFEKAAYKYNRKYSESSNIDLGWINSSSLAPEILKELRKIEVGEITKPIIRQNSIIILKLADKRNLKKISENMDKIRNNLIKKKRNEQFELYSRSHLSKLKNNSLIEYK